MLLMANILDSDELQRLSDLAFDLGMDVLFETHHPAELSQLPKTAKIIGINSRSFEGGLSLSNFTIARSLRKFFGVRRDHSVNLDRFRYVEKLPAHAIKIAESGISAANCQQVFSLGFHSVLVGTSLLTDPRGVSAALHDFELAINASQPALQPGLPSVYKEPFSA
jgi:indole-3-glycerol phosphate synthase